MYLGASNAVWSIWLPNISDQISSDQNGATTPSSWWALIEPKMTFVILSYWVLDASCKGVPGCIQCSLGHLVAQHSNQISPAQSGATTPSFWWMLNVPKMTFVIFTFWVLDASCKDVPGCIQCSSGHLVAQHFRPNFSSSEWCHNTIILVGAE